MIRIAIQAKGRLNEQSLAMLSEAGVEVDNAKRKFLTPAGNFPAEVLFLRDDDIPQAVAMGVADLGIVGLNEVLERGYELKIEDKLGFGDCRISLAVPKNVEYSGLEWFNGKRVATSYPNILFRFFAQKGISAEIHTIAGSVEIAPTVGMSDAIFDIVSSGATLISNGLVEVEKVIFSEAVLVSAGKLSEEKQQIVDTLRFRFDAVKDSRDKRYLLMNIPNDKIEEAIKIVPAMRSPTVLPLAQSGWSSLHSVVRKDELWAKIEQLRAIGAEGILVLELEKLVR